MFKNGFEKPRSSRIWKSSGLLRLQNSAADIPPRILRLEKLILLITFWNRFSEIDEKSVPLGK